jgi:hypothetical protein
LFGIGSGIDEGSECHIAADTGGTFKPGSLHGSLVETSGCPLTKQPGEISAGLWVRLSCVRWAMLSGIFLCGALGADAIER